MTDKEPLDERIVKWLGTTGYGLEYRTYKAFNNAGIQSLLGQYLTSADGTRREIDVSGSIGQEGVTYRTGIYAFCECKYSESAWVIMMSDLTSGFLADWGSIPQSYAVKSLYPAVPQHRKKLETCWHFAKDQVFGHSLLEFRNPNKSGDNRDAAFNSLQKIANAAWDHVEASQEDCPFPMMTFPVLVVGAPLFQAHYDYSAQQFYVNQVPYGRLSWTGCRDCTVVDVVNIDHVDAYAKKLAKTMNTIQMILEPMADSTDLSDIE